MPKKYHVIGEPTYQRCPTPTKASYDRKSHALIACDKVAKRFELTPYLCPCGRYHLTSQGGRNDHNRRSG